MSTSESTPSSSPDAIGPAPARPPGPPMIQPSEPRRPMQRATWGWLIALIGWTALLSFYHLDGGSGLEPVEAWVAQTSRETYENVAEMVAEIDEAGWQWRPLVIPEFCGETRMQKSPGPYWAVCLTSLLRGSPVDEVSARIPNAIAALLLVMTVFWLTQRIAGDRAAVFAGFAAASSSMVLYWSHGAASDLGVTTLIALSLACLWIGSEAESPGWKRHTLWMLGYFFAGLGMLYKMPLPLVCIGLPAFLYVLLFNRWRIFASGWHLLGLVLFLLPWLPWALAAWHFEPTAIDKWRVEFFDRVTGELPNVEAQKQWFWYLYYVGVALLLAAPYSLSLPGALVRGFRGRPGFERSGMRFALIWFISLLAFFTIATGKETRYFLPAMPPLFVLLGCELAALFDPQRRAVRWRDRLALVLVCVLVPAVLAYATTLLHALWEKHTGKGIFTWAEIWQPYAVAAAVFSAGTILAAVLYVRRREHASFAALVGTMWIMWLWAWPNLLPVLSSQMASRDFAEQLKALSPAQRAALRQVAHQDPRYIWYSDVRFPRVVDQLELLESEGGRRDLEYEKRRVGEKMVRLLEDRKLVLFVASMEYYVMFHADAHVALEQEGRDFPETQLWLQMRVGREDRRYVVFANQPPPWEPPQLPAVVQRALEKRRAQLGEATRTELPPAATQAVDTSEE